MLTIIYRYEPVRPQNSHTGIITADIKTCITSSLLLLTNFSSLLAVLYISMIWCAGRITGTGFMDEVTYVCVLNRDFLSAYLSTHYLLHT